MIKIKTRPTEEEIEKARQDILKDYPNADFYIYGDFYGIKIHIIDYGI